MCRERKTSSTSTFLTHWMSFHPSPPAHCSRSGLSQALTTGPLFLLWLIWPFVQGQLWGVRVFEIHCMDYMAKLLTWIGIIQARPPLQSCTAMSTLYRYTLHTDAGRQHHPKTSRVPTALCPHSGVLWEAAQITQQKWATFSNLLCYIFPVAAQMILCPGEPGSGAWWEHPGCWLMGSCWRSWRPRRKTRTTWRPPHSERDSYKPWITLPKECSGLLYSVGKNITSGENFICGDHLWIVGWALALLSEMAGELFGFVFFTHPDNHFSLEIAKSRTVSSHHACYNWPSITQLCSLLL